MPYPILDHFFPSLDRQEVVVSDSKLGEKYSGWHTAQAPPDSNQGFLISWSESLNPKLPGRPHLPFLCVYLGIFIDLLPQRDTVHTLGAIWFCCCCCCCSCRRISPTSPPPRQLSHRPKVSIGEAPASSSCGDPLRHCTLLNPATGHHSAMVIRMANGMELPAL